VNNADVMMLTLDKERRVQPLIQALFNERNGQISPDGRWLAYESNESGQYQIYVRPFPDVNSGRWQVSTAAGTQPRWARNGQELLYVSPMGELMAVTVGRGASWTAGRPTKLFDARKRGAILSTGGAPCVPQDAGPLSSACSHHLFDLERGTAIAIPKILHR
jgi:hypothetical protein